MKLLYLTLMGLCFSAFSFAQVQNPEVANQHIKFYLDSLDYKIHQSTRLTLESNFMNRVLYSGRDYGLKGFGTSSQLSFTHKSGFWLSTVGYYWQGSSVKFPKADVQVGYAAVLDKRLSASFSYSRWMYFGRSRDELRWAFDNFFSTYWTINAGFMGISPSFYYMTSPSENVAQFALTASKYFEVKKPVLGGKLIIEPNITWMTSTRDRYNALDTRVREGKILRVIDYEMVIPVIYRKVGYFDFVAKTHLTYPLNINQYDNATQKLITFFSADLKIMLWRGKAKVEKKSLL